MSFEPEVDISHHSYGKNFVRVLFVRREDKTHHIKEIEVCTRLTLNNVRDYTQDCNMDVIPTDTQKNTVYALAKKFGVSTIEEFAMNLANHFLAKYHHVMHVEIDVSQVNWQRVIQDGQPHVHAFISQPQWKRFCSVTQDRHGLPRVSAGIKDMKILKTTMSAFKGFIKCEYTSLKDADDRIFSTIVGAKWDYSSHRGIDFDSAWEQVKSCIMEKFFGPPTTGMLSTSVQTTLYGAAKLAIARVPQIQKLSLEMPNVHYFEVDFSRLPKLGITKNNEVFIPTDKPSGNITATIERQLSAKL